MDASQMTIPEIPPALPKRTLDMIVQEYMAELYENEGEFTLKLDELDAEIDDKTLAYKRVALMLEGHAAAQAAEKKWLKDQSEKAAKREAAIYKEIEGLKKRLGDSMKLTGKTSIQTVYGKIYFKKVESVKLPDDWAERAAKTHPEYVKVTHEPKKSLLMSNFRVLRTTLSAVKLENETRAETLARAHAEALAQMPEGFGVEDREDLYGI